MEQNHPLSPIETDPSSPVEIVTSKVNINKDLPDIPNDNMAAPTSAGVIENIKSIFGFRPVSGKRHSFSDTFSRWKSRGITEPKSDTPLPYSHTYSSALLSDIALMLKQELSKRDAKQDSLKKQEYSSSVLIDSISSITRNYDRFSAAEICRSLLQQQFLTSLSSSNDKIEPFNDFDNSMYKVGNLELGYSEDIGSSSIKRKIVPAEVKVSETNTETSSDYNVMIMENEKNAKVSVSGVIIPLTSCYALFCGPDCYSFSCPARLTVKHFSLLYKLIVDENNN